MSEIATAAPNSSPGAASGARSTVAARGEAPVEPNSRYASPVPPRPGAPASRSVHGRPSTSMPDASAAPKRSPAAGAPAPWTLASVTARGVWLPSRTTIAPADCARCGTPAIT